MPDIVQNFDGCSIREQVIVDKSLKKQAGNHNCLYPFLLSSTASLLQAHGFLLAACPFFLSLIKKDTPYLSASNSRR
jgi:hypothetical protein